MRHVPNGSDRGWSNIRRTPPPPHVSIRNGYVNNRVVVQKKEAEKCCSAANAIRLFAPRQFHPFRRRRKGHTRRSHVAVHRMGEHPKQAVRSACMTDEGTDGQAVMLFFTAAASLARSANPHTFSISSAAITRLLFLTPSSHSSVPSSVPRYVDSLEWETLTNTRVCDMTRKEEEDVWRRKERQSV